MFADKAAAGLQNMVNNIRDFGRFGNKAAKNIKQ
jgi:hypothetical protein